MVEQFEVLLQASLAFLGLDLAWKDEVHEGALKQHVAEETCNHAERKVEGEEVEHGQVRQE